MQPFQDVACKTDPNIPSIFFLDAVGHGHGLHNDERHDARYANGHAVLSSPRVVHPNYRACWSPGYSR